MEFNLKKGVQIINFFAKKEQETFGITIDKLKILKLVWIADRLHLRKYGKLIVGDTYFAMKLGPVASGIKNICDKNETFLPKNANNYINTYLQKYQNKIKSKKEIDLLQFSDSNIEVLNIVYERFGNNKGHKLVDISHKYPEWRKFETKLKAGTISQAHMSYFDFFENTPEQDSIFDISEEHLELTKDIFQENLEFDKLFS